VSDASHYLLWIAVAAIAFFRPRAGEGVFRRAGRFLSRLSRHRTAAWIGIGTLALVLRGALLPFWPAPKPVIYDEFGYLLQADTFAHGRLTNPAHPLWQFFESPYILQHPTYAAKYPPAQGLAMAAGQVIFGDPWFGVWMSCAAMLAALVWALQGWLPPRWALLGGLMATPLAITSYWMNSYWGGAVAAIGGALVLGGYARVVRGKKSGYALAIGIGLAILANSRPFEGVVFSIPVVFAFISSRPGWKSVALIVAVLLPAAAATGYYNLRVTGNPLQMPFTEYANQYAYIPLFNFQPLSTVKMWRTPIMRDVHANWERKQWDEARTSQLIPARLEDWRTGAVTVFHGMILVLPMFAFLPILFRDRRVRLPLVCLLAVLAGTLIEVRCYPHYMAPPVGAAFIVLIQALRHLRMWKLASGRPVGRFLVRVLPAVTVGMAMASQGALLIRQAPPENSQPRNARRAQVEDELAEKLGQHVILVRYTDNHSPHEEWVYNGANIDGQDVVWAHDLGPDADRQLLDYYKDRHVWLLQPDINAVRLDSYR
jgi:hypothetical protein